MNSAQMQFREGTVVCGRYRVEQHLGAGAMGRTYLCRDIAGSHRQVAVKILDHGAYSPEPASASSEEFSLLRQLRHPNLVHILDFGVMAGSENLYLVHEWVRGKNLYSATERMATEKIVGHMMDLAASVHYLHARGILHGNLKPPNLFLSEEGSGALRNADFGLLRYSLKTRQGVDTEMLPYTAPEIIMGKEASRQSDFYSFGVLLYQFLSRHLPFEDADAGFLVQKHLQGSVDFRPIERLHNGSRLSRLLSSLLEKDPSRRPASAEEVIRMMEESLGRIRPETDIRDLGNHFSASRFVGREAEMSHLKNCMQRARESGRGYTLFIAGEAGCGKTRCMEELRSWALLEGCQVAEGKCRVREEGAYGPYRQILANSEPQSGESLFEFQDAPRATDIFEPSSEHAAGQFRDLLTRELIRRLNDRPTLLLLDDYHLADEATSTVLDYLSSDIQAHPVLMCVGLRTGDEKSEALERVMDSIVRQERGEILALEPLTSLNVESLIESMTGDAPLKSTLGPWIFKSFGGNPFFLGEVLRHLVEQKLLIRELGKWRFVEERLRRLEIPAGVGAVLRKRLARLSASAREVANWLSLFQGAVPADLLGLAMVGEAIATEEALTELLRRQMIQMEPSGAESTVEFRHSLIAEVIRGDLSRKQLRHMHRRIAAAIEEKHGAEGHVQELAVHYMEGKAGSIAVRYALAAAAQSRAEFAHENALRCFDFIFKNRQGLTDEQICAAAIEASDTMFALGLPKRSVLLLKNELYRCRDIPAELKARICMQLALSYQHLGDLRLQEKFCREGLRFLRNLPSKEANTTKAMLWAELAFAAILQSRSRRGLVYLEKARRSCPDKNAEALIGRIYSMSASLHRIAGNLHEALAASENAAEILGSSQESYLACSAYSMLGHILATLGRFPLAIQRHAQAVTLSDKSRSVVLRSQALANLAECLCRMGRVLEAANAAELAEKSVREANNPAISYAFNTILAEIKLAAGDYQGAHQVVARLDQDAKHNQAAYIVGHALYVAANLSFILGDFAASRKCIEKLRRLKTREAPFYERELADALDARILAESGYPQKALTRLRSLEKEVMQKRWPYQECVIKLHMCELYLKEGRMDLAEQYARGALALSEEMEAAALIGQSKLVLGQIYARVHDPVGSSNDQTRDLLPEHSQSCMEKAIVLLGQACQVAENGCLLDTAWKAHAELCHILKTAPEPNSSLEHAKKSYELLCKIEEQVPSDMLPLYWSAFGRSRAKADLVRIIESGREREAAVGVTVADIRDDEKARILLRVSATVNTIGQLGPLLESILDQLITALRVERAFVFLRDELTGSLQYAKGRNCRNESLTGAEKLDRTVLAEVFQNERPIVSANTRDDPRLHQRQCLQSSASRTLLCAPLKLADRVLGVLYADHSMPAGSLSDSAISLFAAFCNLAAIAIDHALAHRHLVKEKKELERYVHQAREDYEEIIGRSPSVELLRDRIGLAANLPLNILIIGESGSGKELVAKAIHRSGRRKSGRFIPVDCGSLSDSLAEAELFGFRKGAFTGAAENRQGLIEAANGGILFLDEIANMPYRLQAKLLRVIQEREVRRLGETVSHKVDFQLIAATNKDLLEEVKKGQFREDLYYRLNAFEIRVPPLRERSEDIPLLIEAFLEEIAVAGSGRSDRFLPAALQLLKQYSYPGNIRELKNIIVRAYFSPRKGDIGIENLPPEVRLGIAMPPSSEANIAAELYRRILDGEGDFNTLVRKPFLRHQYGAAVVRDLIEKALKDSEGIYRRAYLLLRIPEKLHRATMQFLKRHKCYPDYRPFRRKPL